MHKISTSSLAKERKLTPAKLFESLQELGFIVRKNESWELTDSGKKVGGELQKSDKFWEYIIWPTDLKIESLPQKALSTKKYLNATVIWEHFKTSSQRLNLILSELGLVEKDVAGWRITKLGKSLGWTEHIHDISGAHYVLWMESILTYSRLLEKFNYEPISEAEDNVILESSSIWTNEFRDKFDAKYRTQDWHRVRSRAEAMIDDWLYHAGIAHAYEKRPPINEDMICDFFIPSHWGSQQVYIEYWGLENDEKYLERKRKKLELYKSNELPLIELNDEDIQNLDDVLPRKLLWFKIKV